MEVDKKIIKNTQDMLHQGTSNINSNQSEIVSDSVSTVNSEKKGTLLINIKQVTEKEAIKEVFANVKPYIFEGVNIVLEKIFGP
jgi:hypothetical protein